jgi:hypothetical protein
MQSLCTPHANPWVGLAIKHALDTDAVVGAGGVDVHPLQRTDDIGVSAVPAPDNTPCYVG